MTATVLHVGCGTAPLPRGFERYSEIRLDIDERVKPDIVASLTELPIADESFDCVYSSHNVEHLYPHEVNIAFKEFRRVLKNGGQAIVLVPDIGSVTEQIPRIGLNGVIYRVPAGEITVLDVIYGWTRETERENNWFAHKTGFTKQTLSEGLVLAGFVNQTVKRLPDYQLFATAFRG